MAAAGTGVAIVAFSSSAGCQPPVQPSPNSLFASRWNDTPEDSIPRKNKKKRKSKATMPGGVGGFECPMCAMVKAGPCEYTFYPFEECLIRCHESGEDTWATCKEQFMEMMRCMGEFKQEYDKIIKETMPDEPEAADSPGNGESVSHESKDGKAQ